MRFIDRAVDVFIRTTEDGTIIFRTNRFWGKKYIIPSQQQADAIRSKLKRAVTVCYALILTIFITSGYIKKEDHDVFLYTLAVLAASVYALRFFYFKSLTRNLLRAE